MAIKKTMKAAALAALGLLGGANYAFAGGGQGTSAFQFLQLGVGARPAAMGETFAGVADDVNSIYWNPAGLAGLERREATLSHALWLEGITYSNGACALPLRKGTIGVAFNVLNTGDIQKVDNTGLRLAENFNQVDAMGIFSYARKRGALALGANLKYISSRIEEETAHSYAADLGALYSGFRPWGKKLSLGLSVQNMGTKAEYVSEKFSLPVVIRAGGSLQLFKSLLIASDLNYMEGNVNLHSGAEYTRAFGTVVLAARAGFKDDTIKELGALSGLTAGLGVKWGGYQLDYAWNSFTDLGITQRISLGIKFGGIKIGGTSL
ncbi:MAG: PorV/PorQ family protein [Elusimicrobiales bacterium]|nr:PorV/PorQ family protein [Elusimicrobiales bacterium]